MHSQSVNYTPLTPLSFLYRNAAVYPERLAVVHGEQRFNYAQLLERSNRLAAALRRAGVDDGDRVALLCPNVPAMIEAFHGIPMAGGVLVAINTRLNSREVEYILNHCEAKAALIDTHLAETVLPLVDNLPHLKVFVNVDDQPGGERLPGPTYEEFLSAAEGDRVGWLPNDEQDLIALNYTSGTTGAPKGVMYTHRNAYLHALQECVEFSLGKQTSYLWTLPMFHCNGWCYCWAVVAAGGKQVCLRAIDPPLIIQFIKEHGITNFCAAPTVLIMLFNHPAAEGLRFDAPVTVLTGAAAPSPTMIERTEALGLRLVHLYGLTEAIGAFTLCAWHDAWDELSVGEQCELKARQGVPYLLAGDLRVVNEQMQDVTRDGQSLGEVVLRGNSVMQGYFRAPEATAEAFAGDWFHTGDLAVWHPDGYMEVRDRKKDIIISGGENISTLEVESVISRHPAVQEVAVISAPDATWGEVPKAFVVPKAGITVTAEEIISFCRREMAHFKCPRQVVFGELPRTSTGKIQKFKLREQEWAGHATGAVGGDGA